MSYLIDSSVWVFAMVEDENWHCQSSDLMDRTDCKVYVHAVSEVFSTLTGGRKGFRMFFEHTLQEVFTGIFSFL